MFRIRSVSASSPTKSRYNSTKPKRNKKRNKNLCSDIGRYLIRLHSGVKKNILTGQGDKAQESGKRHPLLSTKYANGYDDKLHFSA